VSALLFVRDGRTLPFVPITVAALTALRERVPKRRPYAVATYVALLELANENRADRVAVTQREITDRVGASRSTVQTALADLVEAGVLVIFERSHGAARIENEYVIVEPDEQGATSDTLARDTGDPRPSHRRLPLEEVEKGKGTRERASSEKPDPREAVPDDFPPELRPHAREVMRVLVSVAEQHNARKVWPLAVARVVAAHPRHPLVGTAHALAAWAVDPPRPIKDVVGTYRTFLARERELATVERLAADGTSSPGTGLHPPGVVPLHAVRRESASDLLNAIAGANPGV
jgi:hypothetical protein